jgi:hypothetical protein
MSRSNGAERQLFLALANQQIEANNAIFIADTLDGIFGVDVVFELNNLLR